MSKKNKEKEPRLSVEDIKKKVLEIYELLELDIDDLTEDEICRIASYYHKNLEHLERDLLNIRNKKEDGAKE